MTVYTFIDIALQVPKRCLTSLFVVSIVLCLFIGGLWGCQKKSEAKNGEIDGVKNNVNFSISKQPLECNMALIPMEILY